MSFKKQLKSSFIYKVVHAQYQIILNWYRKQMFPIKRLNYIKNYDNSKLYINIGGGNFLMKNWRVMDFVSSNYPYNPKFIDFNQNLLLMEPWSISPNSVNLFYTSHCLEHLPTQVGQYVINQAYKTLKPNGVFRITVPNIDPFYEAYLKNDFDFIKNNSNSPIKTNIFTWFLGHFSNLNPSKVNPNQFKMDAQNMSKTDFLNLYSPSYIDPITHDFSSHVTWYNPEKIEQMAKEAGFSQVLISSKGKSISAEMQQIGFDHKPGIGNLYMDLIK